MLSFIEEAHSNKKEKKKVIYPNCGGRKIVTCPFGNSMQLLGIGITCNNCV